MERNSLDRWAVECAHHVSGTVREIVEYCTKNQITSAKILDVGSNVGSFIFGMADHIEVVDALLIEPVDALREYSKERLPQFRHVRNPASNTVQELYLYVNTDSDNFGTSKLMDSPVGELYTTTTLTLLSNEHDFKADIVKVDAEGHDVKCVEGYVEFLQTTGHRPLLINFERTSCMDFSALSEVFALLGYQTYYIGYLESSSEIFFIPDGATPTQHMIRYEKGA